MWKITAKAEIKVVTIQLTLEKGAKKIRKRMDRNDYIEAIFSSIGLVLGLIILYYGVWILSLSLLAYSILTLKSLNFRRTSPSESDLKVEEIHDENIQNA